jgi:N-acetylglucosamine-6-sulfatase
MHINETYVNQNTFVRDLKEQAGYNTGMFGKYMNVMPPDVPPGFDAWMANGGGNYIAPQFQMMNVTGLVPGMQPSGKQNCWPGAGHAQDPSYGCFAGTHDASNYSTAIIGNVSMAWISKVVKEDPNTPFFAYIAPKAAHEPFNPAPWYEGYWDANWPSTEPRDNPAWNASYEARADKHGNIPTQPMITEEAATVITGVFKNRWRTLMSVDDLIADVIALCDDLGVLDNTYLFYSSDHGFQLGENNIIMDKRHVYDFDTRIHLLARGPGIPAGHSWSQPATQVDMAATFVGLAGIKEDPNRFDGRSIAPLLIPSGTAAEDILESTKQHLQEIIPKSDNGDAVTSDAYIASWRNNVFIEYYYVEPNFKCVADCTPLKPQQEYPLQDSDCGDLTPGNNSQCWGGGGCDQNCYATENPQNNFIGIRFMAGSIHGDILYAEFQAGHQRAADVDFSFVDFVELYNCTNDPWQMSNLIDNPTAPPSNKVLHDTLHQWYNCKGETCS